MQLSPGMQLTTGDSQALELVEVRVTGKVEATYTGRSRIGTHSWWGSSGCWRIIARIELTTPLMHQKRESQGYVSKTLLTRSQ